MSHDIDPKHTALAFLDLQNDFIDPAGAYGRAGISVPEIAALPARLVPLAAAARKAGIPIVTSHFTLVPGPDGQPLISNHLRKLRPFLAAGDFAPGSFGQDLVAPLQPSTFRIEKVAYSAFYMTRMEWVLAKAGITQLVVCGIVTNGGVTSTVRDAQVRDIPSIVVEDGCAAFSPEVHATAIAALRPVAAISTVAEMVRAFGG
jgi:ureidoacrylate peracid hydrolase